MKMPAGLIFNDSRHFIDHLAPFCALQGWPLIVCDGDIADLVRTYYPDVDVIERDIWALSLPKLVVSCDTRRSIETLVAPDPSRRFLWLPHGNSDKGWKVSFFGPLHAENALVYGQRMIDFMHQKNVFPNWIPIGNFRLSYAVKNRAFYKKMLSEKLPITKEKKTYLYAPTWEDSEDNGSFWQMLPLLLSKLKKDCNFIVKIHPNTVKKYAPEIERLIGKHSSNPDVFFLTEFPPIYPLLELCDVYIGDMSSVGYDFLYYKRPMYFLKCEDRSQFLYSCGHEIKPENIDSIFNSNLEIKKELQEKAYDYTFASIPLERFRQNLAHLYRS